MTAVARRARRCSSLFAGGLSDPGRQRPRRGLHLGELLRCDAGRCWGHARLSSKLYVQELFTPGLFVWAFMVKSRNQSCDLWHSVWVYFKPDGLRLVTVESLFTAKIRELPKSKLELNWLLLVLYGFECFVDIWKILETCLTNNCIPAFEQQSFILDGLAFPTTRSSIPPQAAPRRHLQSGPQRTRPCPRSAAMSSTSCAMVSHHFTHCLE